MNISRTGLAAAAIYLAGWAALTAADDARLPVLYSLYGAYPFSLFSLEWSSDLAAWLCVSRRWQPEQCISAEQWIMVALNAVYRYAVGQRGKQPRDIRRHALRRLRREFCQQRQHRRAQIIGGFAHGCS